MTSHPPNLRRFHQFMAFGFGSGLAPKAPGTFGTLAAIPLYIALRQFSVEIYWLAVLAAFAAGIYWCGRTARELGVHDHSGIVWDEVVGYLITMAWAPFNVVSVLAGFVAFRVFDIVKPFPIRWVDRHVHGGLGIMLDDVLAALLASAVLFGLNFWLV